MSSGGIVATRQVEGGITSVPSWVNTPPLLPAPTTTVEGPSVAQQKRMMSVHEHTQPCDGRVARSRIGAMAAR